MRYIDLREFEDKLPASWHVRAKTAVDKLFAEYNRDAADSQARKDLIDSNQLWAGIRSRIASVRRGKCWYCESVIKRSHMPVDHFRPKGAVDGCNGHTGYWWLAYDWSNYRFCCTFCNSVGTTTTRSIAGGKGTRFPVKDEADRCSCPDHDLTREQPLLLDPTNAADPPLLWFAKSGEAVPHPRRCGDDPTSYPHRRATVSISTYNLNEDDVKERRGMLCQQVADDATSADRFYARYLDGDGTAHAAWEECLKKLFRAIRADAEYSMAARATLEQLRHKCETAATVLEQCPA